MKLVSLLLVCCLCPPSFAQGESKRQVIDDASKGAVGVRRADVIGDVRLDLLFSCESAQAPRHGLMWLSSDGPPHVGAWMPHKLSGPDGVKHDLIALIDLDGGGDRDVVTRDEV